MTIPETNASITRASDRLGNQSKTSANNLADAAMAAGEELGSAARIEFNNIMSDLQDLVSRASKLSGQELTLLRQQISDKLGLAKEKLHSLSGDASAVAHKGVVNTEQMIKDRSANNS